MLAYGGPAAVDIERLPAVDINQLVSGVADRDDLPLLPGVVPVGILINESAIRLRSASYFEYLIARHVSESNDVAAKVVKYPLLVRAFVHRILRHDLAVSGREARIIDGHATVNTCNEVGAVWNQVGCGCELSIDANLSAVGLSGAETRQIDFSVGNGRRYEFRVVVAIVTGSVLMTVPKRGHVREAIRIKDARFGGMPGSEPSALPLRVGGGPENAVRRSAGGD